MALYKVEAFKGHGVRTTLNPDDERVASFEKRR